MRTAGIRSRAAITAVLAAGLGARGACAASPALETLDRLTGYAEAFAKIAPRAISRETLIQRSYGYPPHPHFAIGAEPVRACYVLHEIVSEYRIGTLSGDATGALLEFREVIEMDGKPMQTPEAARKAIAAKLSGNPDQTRKKILGVFTKLGLVDVATDFADILLQFTRVGARDVQFEGGRDEWVGTEEASVWKWRQTGGGALEFRGRRTARRPMAGEIWIRRSDGAPLRIRASIEHDEAKHRLRDEASVEYVTSKLGSPVPVSVAHRHYVDDVILTENLYLYEPFRLFSTDTRIEYIGAAPQE